MNHSKHREFVQQHPTLLEEQLTGNSPCSGDWQRLRIWGHMGLLHVVQGTSGPSSQKCGHVELAHVEQGTSGPPPHTPHLIMSTSRLSVLKSHAYPHCSHCVAEPSLVSAVTSVLASVMDSLPKHASSSGLFVGKAVSSTSLRCKWPGSR